MLVTIVVSLMLFMSPIPALAAGLLEVGCEVALKTSSLALQVHLPTSLSKPTYLLLPGLNQSMLLEDPALKALAQDGFGVVSMSFRSQPFSIAGLAQDQSARFDEDPVTMESMAHEVDVVVAKLKAQYGLVNIIPVSLSYSGAVSAHLKGYATVIDVVPMTSTAAHNPTLEQYRRMMSLNIFFGRALVDAAYRSTWVPQVGGMLKRFNLPEARQDDMIEGYMSLSRAAEDSTWEKVAVDKTTMRTFVLAVNEGSSLLKDQAATILRLMRDGYQVRTVLVQEAGHLVFKDHPQVYADLLHRLSTPKDIQAMPPVLVVTPSTGVEVGLETQAAIALLEKLAD